jgi:hypothetical protein
MPAPKRLRIVNAVAARAEAVGRVYRDQREPQGPEVPCLMVWAGERTAEETKNKRSRCTFTVTVAGFRSLDAGDSEVIGNEILADIAAAVELEDETLGGLLREQNGLEFLSEEIYFPESGENVVGARVTYSAPHVRFYGDPEIL